MQFNYRTTQLKDLIPPGSVCAGCKKSVMQSNEWRLSIFGDVICRRCMQQEKQEYPDLYADPALREHANQSLTQNIINDVKVNTRREYRKHIKAPDIQPGYVCPVCKLVAYTSSDSRKSWIFNQHTQKFQCKKCFYNKYRNAADFSNGDYLQDKWFRIFRVIRIDKSIAAIYPFGLQRIPEVFIDSPYACQTLFDLQHADMMDTVQEYYRFFLRHVDKLAEHTSPKYTEPPLNYDEIYDHSLTTYMRVATLADPNKPFVPYMTTAITNAINKECNKRRKAYRRRHEVSLETLELQTKRKALIVEDAEYFLEDADRYDVNVDRALLECRQLMGEDVWEMFSSWVLGSRTQESIGVSLGIISQSVSMRFKKLKRECRNLIQPP